jgi:hypothetical protein
VNAEDEYNGMLLQTKYQKHSANWERMVDEEATRQESELNEQSEIDAAKADPTRPEFYATVDKSELYDGMLYQRHSQLWESEVDAEAARQEQMMNDVTEEQANKADPTRPEFYASDKSDLYSGMLVQLKSQGSGHSKAFMKIQDEAEQTYEADERAAALAEQEKRE